MVDVIDPVLLQHRADLTDPGLRKLAARINFLEKRSDVALQRSVDLNLAEDDHIAVLVRFLNNHRVDNRTTFLHL